MTRVIASPLTREGFAPFGDVIELADAPTKLINQGLCGRHHDLAQMDFADGRAGISLFDAEPRALPYKLEMVERHPDGSQAFLPMNSVPMLVTVAPDDGGKPGTPVAFVSAPGQGINLHRGVWHGVLAPLDARGLYAVVDRIGPGDNLQEYWFQEDITIVGTSG